MSDPHWSSPPPLALQPLLTNSDPRPTNIRLSATSEAVATKNQQLPNATPLAPLCGLTTATDAPSPRVYLEALSHLLKPGLVSDLPLTLRLPVPFVQHLVPQLFLHCQDLNLIINFYFHNIHSGSASQTHTVSYQLLISSFSARHYKVCNRHSCGQTTCRAGTVIPAACRKPLPLMNHPEAHSASLVILSYYAMHTIILYTCNQHKILSCAYSRNHQYMKNMELGSPFYR